MITEKQQYATIDCKKVAKAKTVSLKLFDQKDQKTQFQKEPIYERSSTLQQRNFSNTNIDFSYLDHAKGVIQKEKSFDEIMNETRKILELRRKMEEDEKKRNSEKKERKYSKSKKEQKTSKKLKKAKKKQQKEEPEQEQIALSPLDIEKFQTENISIKRIIQKIQFLENLSQKCDIFAPVLQNFEKGNDQILGKEQSKFMGRLFENKQFQRKLEIFELEIELMEKNLESEQDKKEILTPNEIQELAKWQVHSRTLNNLPQPKKESYLLRKYTDSKNLDIQAEQLENELEYMRSTFFSLI